MNSINSSEHRVIGLDIGIASVGWAVLGENRIVDIGVRCFEKGETSKKGESLNLARRNNRLQRRRLYRRAWRLTKLSRLLKREGLIENSKLFLNSPSFAEPVPNSNRKFVASPWTLRLEGLDRLLTKEEWSRVIYHICKHRGFHWISKADEARNEKDQVGGRVKQALDKTQQLMKSKGYRTVAEMVLIENPKSQRNKQGNYDKSLSRLLLDQELCALFEAQRNFGNVFASQRFEMLIHGGNGIRAGLFWEQKPALAGDKLLEMLGKCTFEKKEYRAPKASFTAELHVWLTQLNNLRVIIDGHSRALLDCERKLALEMPYKIDNFKYKTLKNAFIKSGHWPEDVRFGGLSYLNNSLNEKNEKDPEEQILIKLNSWHEMRRAFQKANKEAIWHQISIQALDGQPDLLDQISYVLSVYKEGSEITKQLRQLNLPASEEAISVLETLSFEKFSNLSLKALRQIVKYMHQGLRYGEAVKKIPNYGHHSQLIKKENSKNLYLPPFYANERNYKNKTDRIGSMKLRDDANIPRNPVVLRALNQARKVVNALIREYGSPSAVHIEMARDLSRPMLGHKSINGKYIEGRKDIEEKQLAYKELNNQARQKFESTFGFSPKGSIFEKWMLYCEQQGQCAYSQHAIDISRLFDDLNYVQVDHALPYSRSYDDSKNNKVLVLTKVNQEKGNRTPYEYLTRLDGGEEGKHWHEFEAWVNSNKSYRMAKRNRLLRKDYGSKESEGFKERNLNDTRYICKFFKNYIEEHLELRPKKNGDLNRRCVVVNGQLTGFLRSRWGLSKVREESDRHHALDAAVVAACSHSMVKALADYSRIKEIAYLTEGFPDPETGEILNRKAYERGNHHFPEPWAKFRQELITRLSIDDVNVLRENLQTLGTYDKQALCVVRPLFVSRAVQKRNTPAIHEATLRSPKHLNDQKTAIRVSLSNLTLEKLDSVIEANGRNKPLVDGLRNRLLQFSNDPKKAFATPFLKPSAIGKIAPTVTSVKILSTQNNGFKLKNAIADLGEMTGVRVYRFKNGVFVEPTYIAANNLRLSTTRPPPESIFLFTLTKNEFVEIVIGKEKYRGYFVMFESDGRMTLRAHDQPQPDKKFFRKSINSFQNILKFNIDILGNIYPAPPEVRSGLA